MSAKNLLKFIEFLVGCGPTGYKAADGVKLTGLTEMSEAHLLTEFVYLFVVDDNKLLVGGGFNIELESFPNKDLLHAHGHLDGMLREYEVEVVGEQSIELQSDKSSFGDYSTVLLLDREEVLVGILVSKHYCLAAESANLGATDIEHVAVARQIRQADVVARCL